MWFEKGLFSFKKESQQHVSDDVNKVRVGILGTGKIGTDLLVKVLRSPTLECTIFAGRNLQSEGMQYADALGVPVSDQGIHAFLSEENKCDIVFDATSAAYHLEHAMVFQELGVLAIDMTPSAIGESVVPAIGMDEVYSNSNISMVSCGGQASIPVAHVVSQVVNTVKSMKVESIVAPSSIGPGTWANIEEYYRNTKNGLQKYSGISEIDIALRVDEENPETNMITMLTIEADSFDLASIESHLDLMLSKVREYIPGYEILEISQLDGYGFGIKVSVEGVGDYLPKFAGNLDIINCAAISVAEEYAREMCRQAEFAPSLFN